MTILCILGARFATEPGLPESTDMELEIVPLIPEQYQLETEVDGGDPLMLEDDDDNDESPAAESKNEPAVPPKPKKRKVTHQDIQAMQLEVLTVEKSKINLEVENLNG